MDVVPLEPAHAEALRAFFGRLPEGDRTFFKEDVTDDHVVAAWVTDTRGRRRVVLDDGEVVAYVAVLPGLDWSSHVGEVRLVVDPTRRRAGLGRRLARGALLDALELGLNKVFVEVVADHVAPVELFLGLGFEGEALLQDHVRDRAGELRDLLVLSHRADDTWQTMAAAGIDEALGDTA
jgi:ribosomal protein S18 acetylase RimI-like enzyme